MHMLQTRLVLCENNHSPCCLSLGCTCIRCCSPILHRAHQYSHPAETKGGEKEMTGVVKNVLGTALMGC